MSEHGVLISAVSECDVYSSISSSSHVLFSEETRVVLYEYTNDRRRNCTGGGGSGTQKPAQ
jgi:hypothetical protein